MTEEYNKNPTDRQVAVKMHVVCMERECGDESPPLAIQNFSGLGVANGDPVEWIMTEQSTIEPGKIVEDGHGDKHRQAYQGVLCQRVYRRSRRRPVTIFRFKET